MKVQVILDASAATLTVHAEGYSPAIAPDRVAATIASIIANALTEPPAPARSCTADEQVPPAAGLRQADPAPFDPARPAARPVGQRPETARITCPRAALSDAPAVPPVAAQPVATQPVGSEVAAGVVAAPRVPTGDRDLDEPLRRAALELLDQGLSDDQVCSQLGISQPRLLRLDDLDREFLAPPADRFAAVTA